MIRIAVGWQTMIADLALILFLLTAAALTPSSVAQGGSGATGRMATELENASAVYRAEPAAPPLGQWLAEQSPDPRQRLTVVALYRPGGEAVASARAFALLHEAGPAAAAGRVMLEQGDSPELLATLSFDLGEEEVARSLQGAGQTNRPDGDRP